MKESFPKLIPLFDINFSNAEWQVEHFSANNQFFDNARIALENISL
jgi:hypothetical protein